MLFLFGFIFFPIKSLGDPPQEVDPCFQSHFLISSSEFPIIEFSLGLLVVHLGSLAFHSVGALESAVSILQQDPWLGTELHWVAKADGQCLSEIAFTRQKSLTVF